jgi:uncharacterized protein (TIGR00725 family)
MRDTKYVVRRANPGSQLPSRSMTVIAVIGSSRTQPDEPEYGDALRLGGALARAGFTVASGGYGGLMDAVSAGAADAGGQVIGVTAPHVFPGRKGVNRYVTVEEPAESLTERIHRLIYHSDAVVALPGSIGTLTELMSAWNLAFVAPFSNATPKPVIAVGPLWRDLIPLLAERLRTDGTLVRCVDTADEAARMVINLLDGDEGR